MNTQQKCVKILKRIVELNQDINDKTGILFTPDWAGNSLTVEFKGGHTHCGNPEGNFKQLIDSLYNMLCEKKGLSLVETQRIENWIDVKDKLPEIQKWVLIILESGDMFTSFYDNNEWVFDVDYYSEVTHWMSLPEKPTKWKTQAKQKT